MAINYRIKTFDTFEKSPVNKITFSNGAVLVHQRAPGMRGASLNIWFQVGSRHENPKNQGISHLVEHMIFKGTHPLPQKLWKRHFREDLSYADLVEYLGGSINAYTSKEYMQFELSCLASRLPDALPVFMNMVLGPRFLAEQLEEEKKVVIQEIKEDRDDFEIVAEEKLFEKAYSFPIGHSIGGTVASVKSISQKQLKNFYKKNFIPPKMIISLVADVDYRDYLGAMNELFGHYKWDARATALRPKLKEGPIKLHKFKTRLKRSCEVSTYLFNTIGTPIGSAQRGSFIILDHLLSDGMSSRLFKALRIEEGLVYGLSSGTTSFTDNGSFEISLACPKKSIGPIRKKVNSIIESLATRGPDAEELASTKRAILDNWEMSFDDIDETSIHLGLGEMFRSEVLNLAQLRQMINSVDKSDIAQVCRQILGHGLSEVILTH